MDRIDEPADGARRSLYAPQSNDLPTCLSEAALSCRTPDPTEGSLVGEGLKRKMRDHRKFLAALSQPSCAEHDSLARAALPIQRAAGGTCPHDKKADLLGTLSAAP